MWQLPLLSLWSLSCQLSTFVFKWQNCNFQRHHREWAGVQEEGDFDSFVNVEIYFQNQSWRLLKPSSHQLLSSGHCRNRSSLDSLNTPLSPVVLLVWSFWKQTHGSLFRCRKRNWGSQKGSELHSIGKQGEEGWDRAQLTLVWSQDQPKSLPQGWEGAESQGRQAWCCCWEQTPRARWHFHSNVHTPVDGGHSEKHIC